MKHNRNTVNLPLLHQRPDAIAIDLDGTLFNSQTQISRRNSKAIEKCLAQGIPVIIATSRPARSVHRLVGAELEKRCSLVLQNGAIGMGALPLAGRIKEIIPSALTRDIIKAILQMEPEMRITIELEGYSFGTNKPRNPDELWAINSATPDMQLSIEEALTQEATKIAAGGINRNIRSEE